MEDNEGTACDEGRWVAAQDGEGIPLLLLPLGHIVVVAALVVLVVVLLLLHLVIGVGYDAQGQGQWGAREPRTRQQWR